MDATSKESNKSSFALFLANYKIHHIIFKSNAYSAVVNGTVTQELKKDSHHCGFGSWYYNQGMKIFGDNQTFKKIQIHHEEFHNLINENLDCALRGGCMAKSDSKDEIVNRFKKAEEHSNIMFSLMDQLVEELGDNINMSNVVA
ncbi:CZB domain-containing protein [Sulfurimonas sp. NWX79]